MSGENVNNYPNCIIAGAPKCGTSSLFFWLSAHPEVCASRIKETYFLGDDVNRHNKDLNIHKDGLAAYGKFFEHCKEEKLRLEATPVYIYYSKPLEVIPQLAETPKIIFILRKPGDRLYSHWRFNRYRMKNTRMSFKDYLAIENKPENWADYIDQTHYVKYIKRWIEAIGKENILVYQFERLSRSQKLFMQEVCRDLGINPGFYEKFDFFHRNETVAVKSKKLHRWGLKIETWIPQWLQEKLIPFYLKFNSSKAPAISEKEKEVKEQANGQFRQSNEELKSLFPQIDLKLWE